MWLCLYSAAELVDVYKDEFFRTQFPDYLFFGTNGGMEMLAFNKNEGLRVVMLDPVAGTESAVFVANSFTEFEAAIGKEFQENART